MYVLSFAEALKQDIVDDDGPQVVSILFNSTRAHIERHKYSHWTPTLAQKAVSLSDKEYPFA